MRITVEITHDDGTWQQEAFSDIEKAMYFLEEVYKENEREPEHWDNKNLPKPEDYDKR